ncbi:hypothetical protein [Microbacterium sp. CFBP9034]|uniref:hypothetical protein n=1 Tax=Microbacterium sp. CFBP9034 TaxID=3096540 RepID=UPI002A69C0B1|nr:hypothetical protein [Microbacterium sp. CFBP9034]MDY0907865.1 hypothetical protein [Microbacterium sp. CFBP9034]
MARIADPFRMRAQAVEIDWTRVAREREQLLGERVDWERLKRRWGDVRVVWACSAELGVPHGPFMVWRRPVSQRRKPEPVDAEVTGAADGLRLTWGGVDAGRVVVHCLPSDPAQPVGLFLYRVGEDGLVGSVGAGAVRVAAGATAQLDVRTGGATWAVLVNGHSPSVAITTLHDIVNADDWEPLELVGLPVDGPLGDYDTSDQGRVDAPERPFDAAIRRLMRGAPPLGWDGLTPAGVQAPPWEEPDPPSLVEEVRKFVFPAVEALYDPGLPEFGQMQAQAWTPTTAPHVDETSTSSLDANADVRPWAVLGLTAQVDPFLNLATGFGSVYTVEPFGDDNEIAIGGDELLITAKYANVLAPGEQVIEGQPLPGGMGSAEFAAYAPRGARLTQVPAPAQLTAARAGLVEPRQPDEAWGESIRLSYRRALASAMLGTPTQQAAIVSDAGAPTAEAIIERRDPQGGRTVAISPDAPKGEPGFDRSSLMHAPAVIPLGSGGRAVRYGLAVADVFGVWSPWRDVAHTGGEPAPELPAIVTAKLDTRYAGSTAAPTTLEVDIATEWTQRRPSRIDVRVVFHPLAPPPATPPVLAPTGPAPAGGFVRDLAITFAGDTPTGVGCTVVELNEEGTAPLGGAPRGSGARRYRLTATVPTLDFATVRRWGAALWTRRHLLVGPTPTPFGARTDVQAASPVPVHPLPPPLLPDVPLASLPDASGCSHASVSWSLPAGADARTAVVWECAETALRQTAGLEPQADPTDSPSERLVAARAAYDALTPDRQRGAFRRIAEVDAAHRTTDVTLPRGSTDIHFFAVTIVSSTAIESPWPQGTGGTQPHEHLRAVIAPRLSRPEPPVVRSSPVATGGGVQTLLRLEAASSLPVEAFRLLRTRSDRAALRADTMGPPFDEVVAQVKLDGATPVRDAVTGHLVYEAQWQGALPPAWTPWLVRAVAVPQAVEPQRAVRGLHSSASDVVSVLAAPDTPPVLEDLVPAETDAAHTGLVVRTATTAPVAAGALGEHMIRARISGAGPSPIDIGPVSLASLAETPLTTPPGGSAVIERGVRSAGRSPLALWFTRADAAASVTVDLTITDPRGRTTTRSTTIPGWTPPPPPPAATLDLLGITPRTLAGVVVVVATDAALDQPYRLRVTGARGRGRGPFRLPRPVFPPLRGLRAEVDLAAVPTAPRPPLVEGTISFRRVRRPGRFTGSTVEIGVPLGAPVSVVVTLIAPDGAEVSVTAEA